MPKVRMFRDLKKNVYLENTAIVFREKFTHQDYSPMNCCKRKLTYHCLVLVFYMNACIEFACVQQTIQRILHHLNNPNFQNRLKLLKFRSDVWETVLATFAFSFKWFSAHLGILFNTFSSVVVVVVENSTDFPTFFSILRQIWGISYFYHVMFPALLEVT